MPRPRAVIFVNGDLPDLQAARALLRPSDALIAADGGTRHILALGRLPSVLIGDLDSLSEEDRGRLAGAGVRIVQHPPDKDETDLELALHYAVEAGHKSLLIIGALGGRLDQTLGNLSLLADPKLAGLEVRLDDGLEEAFFLRGNDRASSQTGRRIRGKPGDTVSLIPWGRSAGGIVTDGLRWVLRGGTLAPHQTRGISNEMLGESATLRLGEGLLLVIHRRNRQSSTANPRS